MALDGKLLSHKEVRLFPSCHVGSEREAELRAAASFLAVTRAVSEFGRSVVSMAGGPKGRIRCYAEVRFKDHSGTRLHEDQLDGILQATRGEKDWCAIVEVKVGNSLLEQEQFDRYHTLAKDQGINAFITISNQAAIADGLPPGVKPDKRRLKAVPVTHFSWERLLSEAQHLSRQEAVADSDQQWILNEWIRYLTDPKSQIIAEPQIGEHWNEVLRQARGGNLSACKSQLQDVVERWDGFLRKLALRLRAKLGVDVVVRIPKAECTDPALRMKNLLASAITNAHLPGVFRIPDAAGDVSVVVLLAARCVQFSIEVKPPTEGRTATRLKWLLKQLQSEDVPSDLVVQVHWPRHLLTQGTIEEVKGEVESLLREVPKDVSPRSYSLQWTKQLLKCKGRSSAPVLKGIAQGLDEFYGRVVESLRPFVPNAPQLREDQPDEEHASEIGPARRPEITEKQCEMLVVEGNVSSKAGESSHGGASEGPTSSNDQPS